MSKAQAIAALGMQAHQLSIESIANNVSNMNTPAYKAARVNFQEMMFPEVARPIDAADTGPAVSTAGLGTLLKSFTPGKLVDTASAFDVAIQGNGFIEVMLPDGTRAYSRGGTLQINKDSMLATAEGYPVAPGIQVPEKMTALSIEADGKILAQVEGQAGQIAIGQMQMSSFNNPAGLHMVDNGTYVPTASSGDALHGRGGEEGLGTIVQKRLEGSNVNMLEEMVKLIAMQQTYNMLSQMIKADDEMSALVNNMRGK